MKSWRHESEKNFLPGTKVRVVKPYLPYDKPVVGKSGVVTRQLGVGLEGPAVEIQFGEDVPEHLRILAFPVAYLDIDDSFRFP